MADNIKPLGIKVDDGRRRVPITNSYDDEVGVFYFNPTDINIIERYNNLAKNFNHVLEPLENLPDSDENSNDEGIDMQRIDALNEAKNRLGEAVNELFGADCVEAFFGSIHPFSPVDGKFYCEVVLEAVGKYISEQFKVETEKVSKRVAKYTNKYMRKK